MVSFTVSVPSQSRTSRTGVWRRRAGGAMVFNDLDRTADNEGSARRVDFMYCAEDCK